jgi:hypothetical protein
MEIVTVALGIAIIAGSFIGLKPTPAADQISLTNTRYVGALALAPACDKKKTVIVFCDQGLPYLAPACDVLFNDQGLPYAGTAG